MKGKDNLIKRNKLLLQTIRVNLYDLCGASSTDRLVLGISGGADSTAMLYLLAQTHPPSLLYAVYVDHQLRPDETSAEINLLNKQCAALGVSFTTRKVNVPEAVNSSGSSVEDAARALRYNELQIMSKEVGAEKICVAHTANDQVEEFFVRLIRGTGSAGLSGMKAVSNNILRPLLTTSKKELLEFLTAHNIQYSEDSSNNDPRYLRNRVRHSLLPFLQENFHKSIGENIRRTSTILQDEDEFIDQHVTALFQSVIQQDDGKLSIDRSTLLSHHIAVGRRLIEKAVWATGVKPTFCSINTLYDLISTGTRGKQIHLPGGLRAVCQADTIQLLFSQGSKSHRQAVTNHTTFSCTIEHTGHHLIAPLQHQLTITVEASLPVNQNECLILHGDTITFPLTLRSVESGDTFQPLGMQGKKKINRFLSDRKIEKLERQNYPILLCEEQVLCIVDLQIDEKFKYRDTTTRYLIVRWKAC